MLGRTPIALLAGVFAIAIGGCGGSDGTIPASDSEQLLSLLSTLQDQVTNQQCTLAEGTATTITETVEALPGDVDPKVQTALTQGAENLAALTKDPEKCVPTGATGETGVETTETTSTTSTETSTPTSTTTTDETAPPEDTGEQPPTGDDNGPTTPPADNGDGNQGGDQGTGGGGPSGGVGTPGGKR